MIGEMTGFMSIVLTEPPALEHNSRQNDEATVIPVL
jgi:hypothetical protein